MSSICSAGTKIILAGTAAALCYFNPALGATAAVGLGTISLTKLIWQQFAAQPRPAPMPPAPMPRAPAPAPIIRAPDRQSQFGPPMSDDDALAAIAAISGDDPLEEIEAAYRMQRGAVDQEEKKIPDPRLAHPPARLQEPERNLDDSISSKHECPFSGEAIPEIYLIDLNDGRGDPQYCDLRFLVKSLLNDAQPLNPFTKVALQKGDLALLCAKLGIQEEEFAEIFEGAIPRDILAQKRDSLGQAAQIRLQADPAYQALAGAVQDDHYVQQMTDILQQHQVLPADVQAAARLELFGRMLRISAAGSPLAAKLVEYYEANGLISIPRLDQI